MNKTIIAERFSKAISTYPREANVQRQIADKMIRLLQKHIPSPCPKVIEFGCGTGIYSRMLLRTLRPEELLLNDLCPEMRYCCEDLLREKQVSFLSGDAETIPFPDKSTLITSCSALQWFESPEEFFKRCNTLLHSQGYFAFSTFGKKNMKEIRELTGKGLPYRSKEELEAAGKDIGEIEEIEPEPSLGNGGLGRLAACFMESLATLGYAAYGCGIRYRYGMFKQQISDGFQVEVPDNWLKNGYPFELRRPEYSYEIKFGGYVRTEDMGNGNTRFIHEGYQSVMAIPYDMPIVGYDNHMVNTLMIWDAEPKEGFQLDSFDKGDYNKAVEQENLARNLVEVLYPNDNHIQGKELRLKQQYFFVSASLQRAIARFKKHHEDIHQLPEKAVFQMNDTHPT